MLEVYPAPSPNPTTPNLHGDCVYFQGKQLVLPILPGDCVPFQGKQLLLPVIHGDLEHVQA